MAQQMKSLAKDTVIYGGSTIIVKFLNWLLVVLFTYTLPNPAEFLVWLPVFFGLCKNYHIV